MEDYQKKWVIRYPEIFDLLPWPFGFDNVEAGQLVDHFELSPRAVRDLTKATDPKAVRVSDFPEWMQLSKFIWESLRQTLQIQITAVFQAMDFLDQSNNEIERGNIIELYNELIAMISPSPQEAPDIAIAMGRFDLALSLSNKDCAIAIKALLAGEKVPFEMGWMETNPIEAAIYAARQMVAIIKESEHPFRELNRLVGGGALHCRLKFIEQVRMAPLSEDIQDHSPAYYALFYELIRGTTTDVESKSLALFMLASAFAPLAWDKTKVIRAMHSIHGQGNVKSSDFPTSLLTRYYKTLASEWGDMDWNAWREGCLSNNQSAQSKPFFSMLAVSGITPRLYAAIRTYLDAADSDEERLQRAFQANPVVYVTTSFNIKRWLPGFSSIPSITKEAFWNKKFPNAFVIVHKASEYKGFLKTLKRSATMGLNDASVSASHLAHLFPDDARRFWFEKRIVPDVITPVFFKDQAYWATRDKNGHITIVHPA